MSGAAALDRFLPEWEFEERHELLVRAAPDRVDRALREVTLADLPAARALFWLRALPSRVGSRRRPSLDVRGPLLAELARGAVVLEDSSDEIVLGLTGDFAALRGSRAPRARSADEFRAYDRADACKAVLGFRVEPRGEARTLLSTETRVHAGRDVRRKFGRYWRVVRPFSGLIRIHVLRAARRRAEAR